MKSEKMPLADYLDNLQEQGQYTFSRKKVLEVLSFSENAFKKAILRLTQKGRVQRIRGDFYILVPLEYRSTGSLPATWFIDDYLQSLNANYYVGLLSAAALQGVAHQQPMVFQVVMDQISKPIQVGRLRIEFHYKSKIDPSFYSDVKTETGRMHVSTPEITACDCVRYLEAAGHIHNVATILTELADQINIETLTKHAKEGRVEVSIIQRLGYLLEYLDTQLPLDDLSVWVRTQRPHYRLLVKGHNAPLIEKNKKWYILVNEQVESDI